MGQAVASSDIIETDTLQQSSDDTTEQSSNSDRTAKKNYLALREFWVGYSGFTPYPGELLKFGRQRLRNDDGQWRDTNIEALNWTFDTTLLKANVGAAERFSEYRTDLKELSPKDKDRQHFYADAAYQWTPGQWIGLRGHHTHDDGKLDYAEPGVASDPLDKRENGDLTWLGIEANSDAYNWRNTNTVNYWASVTGMQGDRDTVNALNADGTRPSNAKRSEDVSGWATDLGIRLRLDPQWQVGAAYARASAEYEQNGLQSNRSNFTGTQSRLHRFGEAFRGEMNNMQSMSLFGSWQLREDYDGQPGVPQVLARRRQQAGGQQRHRRRAEQHRRRDRRDPVQHLPCPLKTARKTWARRWTWSSPSTSRKACCRPRSASRSTNRRPWCAFVPACSNRATLMAARSTRTCIAPLST